MGGVIGCAHADGPGRRHGVGTTDVSKVGVVSVEERKIRVPARSMPHGSVDSSIIKMGDRCG